MSSKQILYISYDGMTDPLGQSQVLPYIEGLSQFGYRYTLISFEKKEAYNQNKHMVEEICQKSSIDWHPLFYTKKPPVLSTVKDVLALGRKVRQLHKKKKFDLLHCRSYIAAIIALKMKRKLGLKFLFDMRGLWADERVDGGQWDLKNPVYKIVYRYFKYKEKQFLENADYSISLTEAVKKEIIHWPHIKNNPVLMEVIPCCADTDLFDPKNISAAAQDDLKKELSVGPDDFILSYVGGVGLWYMLNEMMSFFRLLLEIKPAAKFLFLTADNPDRILQAAQKERISFEKIIIRKVARKDVPLYISLSQASVFFIKPAYSKISSSPTKQGEIMSMGIPVFCNAGVGDTDVIVNKYNSGIVIKDFSDNEYKNAIFTFINLSFDSKSVRGGALEYFNLKQGITKYQSIYKILLGT